LSFLTLSQQCSVNAERQTVNGFGRRYHHVTIVAEGEPTTFIPASHFRFASVRRDAHDAAPPAQQAATYKLPFTSNANPCGRPSPL
jgi:hypothetical protein